MQRTTTTVLGVLLVLVLALLLWKGGPRPEPEPERPSWSRTLASSRPVLPALSIDLPDEPPPRETPPPLPAPTRSLPATAPKSVHFGAIIVRYRGAQLSNDATRSRKEAFELAKQLAELGRKDFKAAVKQGDDGSREDAGRINRNVLEPNVEYELFTLPPTGVSEPIDTPRGFWIAKRLD